MRKRIVQKEEVGSPMQELNVTFTPTNGDPPRLITLRIGTPEKGAYSWSARVEILGFVKPHVWTCQGEDWAQVLELAAKALPVALECEVEEAGGGTLDPSFYERDPQPADLSKLPPEVVAALSSGPGEQEPT